MDDKTPTPDQTPESTPDAQTVPVPPTPDATAPTPDATPDHAAPSAASHAAPSTAPDAAPTPKPGRKRALLIGGGIAAAVVLAGGGIAIGAAIGDDFGDDGRSSMSGGPRHDDADDHGHRGDDRSDERGGDREHDREHGEGRGQAPSNGRGQATGIGTASADELIKIADAARGAADGEVTSIDAKRDGTWEVQLTDATGAEAEVRVDKDLAASVISTDAADGDDTRPALVLDDATIRALVTAALAEAEGLITDLDVDGDDVSPYDASVLTSDNRSVDIEFGADFAVVGTDID